MKLVAAISFVSIALLGQAGCEPANRPHILPKVGNASEMPFCDEYAPAKIDVLPLTAFEVPHGQTDVHLVAYVSLLDSFGSQIKFPAKFRFELYPHVPRSAEPKGGRVRIWPDEEPADPNTPQSHWFDLSDSAWNDHHWRDFFRAYNFNLSFNLPFNLPFKPVANSSYILEVTCLTHDRRRLTAEISLKRAE